MTTKNLNVGGKVIIFVQICSLIEIMEEEMKKREK